MGLQISRRRGAPANTEQKPAEEQTATQTQEVVETGKLDVVEEAVTPEVCLAAEEVKAAAASAPLDAESEPEVKDAPAPAQPEPLVSVSEPSPPETEPAVEPKVVAEVQLAPESAPEPIPEPETVPETEPTSSPEAEADAVPEPISESISESHPAEALQEQTDMLTQESVPESLISAPALIEVSDATPLSISIPAPVDAADPSDIPAVGECQATAEASTASPLGSEKCEETSECAEAEGNLEQVVNDVNEESVSKLAQNLELKGNGPVADLIPTDVKVADDTPIPEVSP